MFERFDDQASFAVERAFEEAKAFRHDQVGTEHLLLGLLSLGEGNTVEALRSCGATLEGCRAMVVEAAATKRRAAPGPELTLTDRAARALERATRLSLRQRHRYVDADHVLLSVLDVEGTAGQVLRGLSVDLGRLRAAVQGAANAGPAGSGAKSSAARASGRTGRSGADTPGPSGPPTAAVTPLCPKCDLALQATLAHKAVLSQGEDGVMVRWLIAYCSSCGAALGGYRLAD